VLQLLEDRVPPNNMGGMSVWTLLLPSLSFLSIGTLAAEPAAAEEFPGDGARAQGDPSSARDSRDSSPPASLALLSSGAEARPQTVARPQGPAGSPAAAHPLGAEVGANVLAADAAPADRPAVRTAAPDSSSAGGSPSGGSAAGGAAPGGAPASGNNAGGAAGQSQPRLPAPDQAPAIFTGQADSGVSQADAVDPSPLPGSPGAVPQAAIGTAASVAAAGTSNRSAFGHVTDGAFTDPDGNPANGAQEWSDVPPTLFKLGNGFPNSYLYADQADLDPNLSSGPASPADTFVLLFDEVGRTSPLGPDQYYLVSFTTTRVAADGREALDHHAVHIFSDGTIISLVNGTPDTNAGQMRADAINGQRGRVGFGPSPNLSTSHLIAEFQIPLSAAGSMIAGSLSAEPQLWTSDAPHTPFPIMGGFPPVQNVAQQTGFTTVNTGVPIPPGTPISYQWTVDGAILKDYSESTKGPWTTSPIQPADFQQQSIKFYWKPDPSQVFPNNGGPVPRKVTLDVRVGDRVYHDERIVMVGRSETNINAQAEDFFTLNHFKWIQTEHEMWHLDHPFDTQNAGGRLFLDFHHQLVSRFNSFRAEFGYPQIGIWAPVGEIPQGLDVDHENRVSETVNNPKPSWFTIEGGPAPRPSNLLPRDTLPGQRKLEDFPADRDLLGVAVESPWHNDTHLMIGGDMASPATALMDPIFWRWHNYVDVISEERKGLTNTTVASLASGPGADVISAEQTGLTPPTVEYQAPFRLFHYLTSLPSVSVTFTQPVTGVEAGDLTVNGSPATGVIGSGKGPYTFTGYAAPGLGEVNVAVASGHIRNANGDLLLADSWTHTLVDPAADTDGDGVTDGQEAEVFLTNPTDPDTDEDGLSDGFETSHAPFDPLEDQAHPHSMAHTPLPGNDDVDGDGRIDIEEYGDGTDPGAGMGHHGTSPEHDGTAPHDSDMMTASIHQAVASPQPDPLGSSTSIAALGTAGDIDADGVADDLDNCPEIPNTDQADGNFNGLGDVCETPPLGHSTAAFLRARTDGTTTVEQQTTGVADGPDLSQQLKRVVEIRLANRLLAGLPVDPVGTTTNFVNSLVAIGQVPAEQAQALVDQVLFIINDPPVVTPVPGQTIGEGSLLTVALQATNPDEPDQTTNSFRLGPDAPPGASIDAATGVFTWVPPDGPLTVPVTVVVTDTGQPARSTPVTFNVTVVNVAPTVDVGPDANVDPTLGTTFTRTGSFADPGADTSTARVNYGDGTGDQPLALNPDKTFVLNHTYAGIGTFPVTVTVTDEDGGVGTDTVAVTVADLTGPTIRTPQPPDLHLRPARLVLSFSEGLDPARAAVPGNYRLFAAGRDRTLGTRDDVPIRVRAAAYDPTSQTVTLRPSPLLALLRRFRVVVNGTGPQGVADRAGNLLDGDGDGRPGGDYTTIFQRQAIGPRRAMAARASGVTTLGGDPFRLLRGRRLP
jgi:hypothetical protein